LLLGYASYYGWQVVAIGTAYKAKVLCSGIFISKRNPENILKEDLEGILSIIDSKIDCEGSSVTTSFPGIPSQQAIFRDGLGCTLLADASEMEVRGQTSDINLKTLALSGRENDIAGFKGSGGKLRTKACTRKLTEVIDKAFSEKDSDNPARTRAVVVIHDGQIIAERYATGITPDTALPGWSMTKSVTNALIGILVKQGRLSIYERVGIAEWSGEDDPRAEITLDQLLRMSSGLKFDERSGPVVSDVNRMLLRSGDVAAYAIAKPLQHIPDTHWHYSSGTTNIISSLIRRSVGGTLAIYFAFPRRELFNKIGMRDATIEPDASGTFVGSSFMYATAQDWARFGLLYLQDGVWDGERILPEGWVSYSTTPTPTAPKGRYGAHFWTNGGEDTAEDARPWKSLPADSFYAAGYEGQYVVVIPSRKLVVVRLGQTRKFKAWDMASFVSSILEVIAYSE
jgi:CubicO group peptidase (beta-lactamase class C family)